ncbi:MAG: hypothetical protein GY754_36745 [bacterium]|nr:hypothetical protein [bacterium]
MDYEQKIWETVFCSLDLETTGPNPAFHDIVEIGMIRFTMESESDVFEALVCPPGEISAVATRIHGITNDMVEDSPYLEDLLDEITRFMSGAILVIQNPEFDLSFLDRAYKSAEKESPLLEAYDTVKMAQMTYPGLENHKLDSLCRHLGIELEHHRALSDTRACMEVFRNIIRANDPGSQWTIGDLVKFHGDSFKAKVVTVVREGQVFKGIRIGERVRIRYGGFNGNITVREIFPKELIKYGKKSYLLAYCFLRKKDRYFRIQRILNVYEK